MDGSGDRAEEPGRRVGKRAWVMGGGAAVVALAVAVGVVVAGDEPAGVASPRGCGTGAHGTAAAAPAPEGAADFDGDGHPDLAFGSTGSVEGGSGGGSIEVAYGTGAGTGIGRCQYLTQDDAGIPGKNRDEAFFGTDVVARDFDGDGYTDLAASVFDWKPSVIIVWGSGDGLSRATRVPDTDVSHVAWDNDPILDEQLVAGDFDGDGHPDLVFGLGSDKGLLKGPFGRDGTPAGTDRVPAPRRPAPDVESANYGDLLAGDLDGDGIDDLVSFHEADPDPEAPWAEQRRPVSYLHGGRDGLTQPEGTRLPDAGEGAVGDVDGDGYDDLVLSPRGGDASPGSVTVVYGSEAGPGKRTTTVDRDTPGVPGEEPQDEDAVLVALDTGDVNGDGYADVVAGAPAGTCTASRARSRCCSWRAARTGSAVRVPGCSTATTSAPHRAGTPTSAAPWASPTWTATAVPTSSWPRRAATRSTASRTCCPARPADPPPRASPGSPGTASTTRRGWAC